MPNFKFSSRAFEDSHLNVWPSARVKIEEAIDLAISEAEATGTTVSIKDGHTLIATVTPRGRITFPRPDGVHARDFQRILDIRANYDKMEMENADA